MKLRYLLFDFDGVVIDNSEGIYNCIRYALDKLGLPEPPERVLRTFVGPSLYESYLREIEQNEARAELFVEYYRERYAPIGKYESHLYPGIPALLDALAADGRRLAVCSGKPLPFVTDIAKKLGVYDRFSHLACTRFSDKGSDKTDLIGECLAHFGAEKPEALMVGDRKYDVLAAKNAGILSLGVRYGFAAPGELEAAGADAVAETPADVLTKLRELET